MGNRVSGRSGRIFWLMSGSSSLEMEVFDSFVRYVTGRHRATGAPTIQQVGGADVVSRRCGIALSSIPREVSLADPCSVAWTVEGLNSICAEIGLLTYKHLLSLSYGFHANRKTGEVLSAIDRGREVNRTLEVNLTLPFIKNPHSSHGF